ncbi:hypothetical protein JEU11_17735 [Paraglaciecola chathamensis]|uniref:Uncharacterized protein n=1 Tax=Paraglaciecola chathamensis TaxID=368405 RepID=A0ABS0WIK0_9ALTE|nr:hypothetical protein [Paraglaciecola chathamensis]MBJ2138307.1 hypothetical protein [Paraglaciecola chathamensis]
MLKTTYGERRETYVIKCGTFPAINIVSYPEVARDMYSLVEAASAHAKAAQKLLEPDGLFLNSEKAIIPVFVNLLLQSVEISLKAFAIETQLLTPSELRSKKLKNGHGIKEIAKAVNEKLSPNEVLSLLLPMRGFAQSNDIVREMIFGEKFEPTRLSYISRKITYSEFVQGELQIIKGANNWVCAVLSLCQNIDRAVLAYNNG